MAKVEWAGTALIDLREIYDYVARDSSRYAQIVVEQITEAASRLGHFSQLGAALSEYTEQTYRQVVVGSYRLIYRDDLASDRILVMAVIHGHRDLPPILEKR